MQLAGATALGGAAALAQLAQAPARCRSSRWRLICTDLLDQISEAGSDSSSLDSDLEGINL